MGFKKNQKSLLVAEVKDMVYSLSGAEVLETQLKLGVKRNLKVGRRIQAADT